MILLNLLQRVTQLPKNCLPPHSTDASKVTITYHPLKMKLPTETFLTYGTKILANITHYPYFLTKDEQVTDIVNEESMQV